MRRSMIAVLFASFGLAGCTDDSGVPAVGPEAAATNATPAPAAGAPAKGKTPGTPAAPSTKLVD